ncbi:MAG TPA: carboxypeptidase-like regulatory domain-containing protein [Planctomycetota bacterium]|nr:carboxypeptidase-like regulatory domain-containing protein [Planctomycetota bacterium]
MHRASVRVFACLAAGTIAPAQQHAIAGIVRTRAGDPTAAAVVVLRSRLHPELPGLVGHTLGDAGLDETTVPVGADGRFRVQPPHPGPFELAARSTAGPDCSAPAFPVMAGAFVELQLAEPVSVAGTVRDADGRPLAATAVTLRPQSTTWTRLAGYRLPEARGTCTTDAQGRFRLPLPDSYLRGPRWEAFVVPDFPTSGLWPRQDNVLLRPTAACARLDLSLVAPRCERGVVLDPDGEPLAGATVFARTAPHRAVASDAAGNFAVPARSRLDVVVLAAGCAVATLPARPGDQAPAVDSVRLRRGALVRARLVDGGHRPLTRAAVLWSMPLAGGPPLEFSTTTDDEGNVAFDRAGADLTVLGFVARGGVFEPFVRAAPAADLDLGEVRLPASRQLRGQVLTSDGTPLPDARVAVLPQNPLRDEPATVTYTDHGGRYAFASLPPGPLDVFAEASMLGLGATTVNGDAAAADLRLSAGGVVAGDVVDGEGNPVASAWLTLVRTGGVRDGFAPGPSPTMTCVAGHSDAQGRFTFRGLPPGTWQVLCNRVHDGVLYGGSCDARTDGDPIRVRLKPFPD